MHDIQIDRQTVDSGTVLHLTRNVVWKSSLFAVVTGRADLNLGAVLHCMQTDIWQVQDLPGQFITDRHRVPGLTTPTMPSS